MTPAETFTLGDHLAPELAARGWTVACLGRQAGLDPVLVAAVLAGTAALTAGIAECLAAALGVSPVLLMNLHAAHAATPTPEAGP